MGRACATVSVLLFVASAAPAYAGGWVDFADETATRMPTPLSDSEFSTLDTQEKDYAWGDVDQDGDIDLVVARKQFLTTAGRRRNVLFLNEGIAEGHAIDGVLVDRSAEFIPGFLDLTNDRDIAMVDVNDDGWLDVITAPTYGAGLPVTISHPRIYINQGEVAGVWQGFQYEQGRMPIFSGAPNFCGIAVGPVDDGRSADVYFIDYDQGGFSSPFDDRLLINNGSGFFNDESSARMTSGMLSSAFGIHATIADMNGDGEMDVVKNENGPIKITYSGGDGFFTSQSTVYSGAAYFHTVGDLNGDGRMDIVVSDDGTDRYMINTGNGADGEANFLNLSFPSGPSSGFGGNSVIVDLNNDGFNDVIIADVDVDAGGCSRRMHIYRNLGNFPNPTITEQGSIIPTSQLNGTHDVAVFDINGDNWLDLVIGRCSGTKVWINLPPEGLIFTYPAGLPGFVTPDQTNPFQTHVGAIGGGAVEPGSPALFVSVEGAPFQEVAMTDLGDDLYEGALPAAECTDSIRFYVTADLVGGDTFFDPPGAPGETYTAIAATGTDITFVDQIEGDVSGWLVVNDASLTSGAWEQAEPNGTIDQGALAAPAEDATAGDDNVQAFVTENGPPGGGAADTDVDGGPTALLSPVFDLDGIDATISYSRWFYCDDEGGAQADFLLTQVSNNGTDWVTVTEHTTGGTGSEWEPAFFVVGDYVEPTDTVRVRFITSDSPNNSLTEAGIDNFQVEEFLCGTPCPSDLDDNGDVGFSDLLAVISVWGSCQACPEDLDDNGEVGFSDLLQILSDWGPC